MYLRLAAAGAGESTTTGESTTSVFLDLDVRLAAAVTFLDFAGAGVCLAEIARLAALRAADRVCLAEIAEAVDRDVDRGVCLTDVAVLAAVAALRVADRVCLADIAGLAAVVALRVADRVCLGAVAGLAVVDNPCSRDDLRVAINYIYTHIFPLLDRNHWVAS